MLSNLDDDWYERLRSLKFGIMTILRQDMARLQTERELFLRGRINHPTFKYNIDNKRTLKLQDSYKKLLDNVVNDKHHHPVITQQYQQRIEERLLELSMVLLISEHYEKNSMDSDEFSLKFNKLSSLFFGKVEKIFFNDVLYEIKIRLKKKLAKAPHLEKQVSCFIDKYCVNARQLATPRVFFSKSNLDKSVPNMQNVEQMKAYFEKKLEKLGIDNAWTVVIDGDYERKAVTVKYDTKRILIPNSEHYDTKPHDYVTSSTKIQKLVAHEIHSHVWQQYNGERSRFKLLGLGLHGSTFASEGIATFREQELIGDNNYFAGHTSYFTMGIALGLDRETPRHFSEVYDVLYEYLLIMKNNDHEQASQLAWNRSLRTFRGTACLRSGVVLTRDVVYREGNIAIHKLLSEYPAFKKYLDIGRYNPTNPTQVEALQVLGLLPVTL